MLGISLALAAPFQENVGFVYKGVSCQSGYFKAQGYCVKEAEYEFTTTSTLMNDYNADLDELLVHKLSVSVKSGELVVGDAPVQITNTGSVQIEIMYLDGNTGLPKESTLEGHSSVVLETAQNGNAALSLIISDKSNGYVPKLHVAPIWMDEPKVVDVAADALERVATVSREQLSGIDGVKTQHIDSVIESLEAMQQFKEGEERFKGVEEDFEDSQVRSVEIKKEGGIVKAIVKTVKGVFHYIVSSVKKAYRAAVWALKQIGLALVKVFHAVKAFFEWGDTVQSLRWLEANILAVRKASPNYIKNNEQKTIENLRNLKGTVGEKLDSIIDTLHGKAHGELVRVNDPAPQAQYVLQVVAQNGKFLEFHSDVDSTMEAYLSTIDTKIPSRDTRLSKVKTAVTNALRALGSGAKKVTVFIVSAVLRALQAIFNLFDDIVVLGVEVAAIIFHAVTELLWTILTYSVNVPFISNLHAKLTGGSELNLLSLVLLPTAAVATWSFKATHWGKAPFNKEDEIDSQELVRLMKGDITSSSADGFDFLDGNSQKSTKLLLGDADFDFSDVQKTTSHSLNKRFLAEFLFFFFVSLIIFASLEIFIRVVAAAVWLAIIAPFTFLAIVLFVFLIAG